MKQTKNNSNEFDITRASRPIMETPYKTLEKREGKGLIYSIQMPNITTEQWRKLDASLRKRGEGADV